MCGLGAHFILLITFIQSFIPSFCQIGYAAHTRYVRVVLLLVGYVCRDDGCAQRLYSCEREVFVAGEPFLTVGVLVEN